MKKEGCGQDWRWIFRVSAASEKTLRNFENTLEIRCLFGVKYNKGGIGYGGLQQDTSDILRHFYLRVEVPFLL